MQANDFQANDLFAQIQGLVEALKVEREAREAAEAADAAKSDLLTIVGRELRAPMQAVVAMGELLLDSELDAAQRRNTETLVQSAGRLLSSLTEVVDFAALESGEAELATERFDLHALVNSAASEGLDQAHEHLPHARLVADDETRAVGGHIDPGRPCQRQ
jgi:signal transduction histidine kinase